METFAERLRNIMYDKGIKQAELVKKTGIGKSSISTYLSGEYEPKQNNIYKIANALDVSINYLMGWEDEEPAETEINPLMTIAAHHDSYDFSEDELKEIESYINYVKSKKAREDDK